MFGATKSNDCSWILLIHYTTDENKACPTRGVRGHAPTRKIFEICVSEMAFPAFWQHFWEKSKHLNWICSSTFLTKLPKSSKVPAPKKCRPGAPLLRQWLGTVHVWSKVIILITKSLIFIKWLPHYIYNIIYITLYHVQQ